MAIKRLTDQFCERVKLPAVGRDEYRDAAFPALEFRVSETGAKSFSLLYRMDGTPKLRRLTLGRWPQLKPARSRQLGNRRVGAGPFRR